MKKKLTTKWGSAALVLGILSLVLIFAPYFGLPLAILAVVFAYKQNNLYHTGNATAGNVLGIIGIIINAIMLLFVVAIFGIAATI